MKQVILNPQEVKTVDLSSVDSDKYYGLFDKAAKAQKGFISTNDNKFYPFCEDGLTDGNGWGQYSSNSLQTCIELFIKSDDTRKVYEFDTAKELFKWLSE